MGGSEQFDEVWVSEAEISAAANVRKRSRPFVRFWRILADDVLLLQPRLRLTGVVIRLIPRGLMGWLRPSLYRMAGIRIGHRVRIFGPLELTGRGPVASRVRIGDDCVFTTPLFMNASAPITIGNHVTVGHHVLIITDSHRYDDPRHRAGYGFARPVIVEDGAWIAASVTILPGVTIGEGSVVAAGAVVTRDVLPHTMVGGVPARLLKKLPRPPARADG